MEHSPHHRTRLPLAGLAGILLAVTLACNALLPPSDTPVVPAGATQPPASQDRAVSPSPAVTQTRAAAGEGEPSQTADSGSETPRATPEPSQETGTPPATAAATADGAALPEDRQPAPQEADLSTANRYAITASIDYTNHAFAGSQLVSFTNRGQIPLDELFFRLLPNGGSSYGSGSLSVDRVEINGEAVATELSGDEVDLRIPLSTPLEPGAGVQIAMDFSGETPENFGSGGEVGYGIYNYSQGVLTLANWYPILAVFDDDGWNLDPVSNIGDSVYSEISFYQVVLQTPAGLTLATTGQITGQETLGESVRYEIESGPARDFVLVMGPEFEVISGNAGDIAVNSFYLPGGETGGREGLEMAIASLETFSRQVGPYPYEVLDVVAVPMRYAAGVEYPGLIMIGDFLYEDPLPDFFELTVAHEVAHQWWYNVVGNDVFDNPWLDEGLTSYTSTLYYEDRYGGRAYQSILEYYDLSAGREGPDSLEITDSLIEFESSDNPGQYSQVVYSRSVLFFAALREQIGDEAFFEALRAYYEAFQFEVARPEDLLAAFEQAAGEDLDAFYEEWLY